LPKEHPDRNRPLSGCFYRSRTGKVWHEIKPTFGIADNTFNELGTVWTDFDDFSWDKS